jgi:hypothetical protein
LILEQKIPAWHELEVLLKGFVYITEMKVTNCHDWTQDINGGENLKQKTKLTLVSTDKGQFFFF